MAGNRIWRSRTELPDGRKEHIIVIRADTWKDIQKVVSNATKEAIRIGNVEIIE